LIVTRAGARAPGDPHAAPLVEPAYLTHEADAPPLIGGVRRALDLGAAASMRAFIGAESLPNADWDDTGC
jgi:hypothetical protein